jgi:hypothetical protein
MEDEKFNEIRNKSWELTDLILSKLGELHLKALYSHNQNQIFSTEADPRKEISSVITSFLIGEQDG